MLVCLFVIIFSSHLIYVFILCLSAVSLSICFELLFNFFYICLLLCHTLPHLFIIRDKKINNVNVTNVNVNKKILCFFCTQKNFWSNLQIYFWFQIEIRFIYIYILSLFFFEMRIQAKPFRCLCLYFIIK